MGGLAVYDSGVLLFYLLLAPSLLPTFEHFRVVTEGAFAATSRDEDLLLASCCMFLMLSGTSGKLP